MTGEKEPNHVYAECNVLDMVLQHGMKLALI